MTLYECRCDVIMSNRRQYDVTLAPYVTGLLTELPMHTNSNAKDGNIFKETCFRVFSYKTKYKFDLSEKTKQQHLAIFQFVDSKDPNVKYTKFQCHQPFGVVEDFEMLYHK